MITTKVKNLTPTKKKIQITVPREKVSAYFAKACQKVGQTAKVKGFRPGKIPTYILEKYYGPEIEYECLNFLVSDTYPQALTENKLTPMTQPKIDPPPLKKEADYSYSVEVEVRPKIKLMNYKGLRVKKHEARVTDEELDAELKRLQNSLAQLAPAPKDAVLKEGLVATIDFEGTKDGQAFKGGSAKDYVFEFGVGQLLKDFEAQIAGMKKGETRNINITFPKDYFEKALAGKNVAYHVTLKNLHVKSLPALDDEMAKDIGKENLKQVKDELHESLIKRKERAFRRDYIEEIKKQLVKSHKFDVPESIVERETKKGQRDKEKIVDQLKLELILEEIAAKENIQVTEQDMNQRLATLSQIYRQPVHEIQKLYEKNKKMGLLATQIVLDKTLDFLVDQAKMI